MYILWILRTFTIPELSSGVQEDEGPKDEDPETNEKNGRLYDKAGKIRKMKHEQVGGCVNW